MISNYSTPTWLLFFFLGQIISLCISLVGTASSALWQHHQISIPFTENAMVCFLLALLHGSWHYYNTTLTMTCESQKERHDSQLKTPVTKRPTYIFLLLILYSILDVQIASLAVMGLKHTSILSFTIIATWNLPCIMFFSALLLSARYKSIHFIAVSLCLIGVGFSIWSDTMGSDSTSNHTWFGDLICFTFATLYGMSTVFQEYLVHHYDIHEFLYQLGIAGILQNSLLAYYFEWDSLVTITWTRNSVLLLAAYIFSMVFLVSVVPILFRKCGATFVSMNAMTSSFYSLVAAIFLLDAKMPLLYPLSYLLVMTGATLYNLAKPPVYHRKSKLELADEHQPLLSQDIQSYHV